MIKEYLTAVVPWSILILLYLFIPLDAENGSLSEVQKLKALNYQLKLQLTQCQVSTYQFNLSVEQGKLIEEFKQTLNPKEGQVFNWNSLIFEDAKK